MVQKMSAEFSDAIITVLRCPKCMSNLNRDSDFLICSNNNCSLQYPIIDNIPVLINEENSVFSTGDYMQRRDTTINTKRSRARNIAASLIPAISMNIKAKENYKNFVERLLTSAKNPKVLIVGSGIAGEGMKVIIDHPSIELYESDVAFGPRTRFILDSHNIPFKDEYFDGVIIQAVLEHVVDPFMCVKEIHRALKPQGFVYAETPFMQQVHEGKYDFHRFTHLGHRRLFRHFSEIESGPICGPGMALAWAYSYFLYSFTGSRKIRKMLLPISHFSSFFLKYFDHYLIKKPGAYDAASAYYFWGQKSEVTLDDKELLKLYKGLL